jgi:DNA-binding beta-propeller fold protein YncE
MKNPDMTRNLFVLLALFLIAGCDSVVPDPLPPEPITAGILVASQGQFGADDGGVALFRVDGTVAARYDGVFVQSATLHDDRLFVASTNRIDVLEPFELIRTGQFTGIPNPRYLAFHGSHAFVTRLFTDPLTFGDGGVTRLDLDAGTTGSTTILGGNPDGITRVGNRIYVANFDFGAGRSVTVLDAGSMAEIERIDVGCDGPRFLFTDEQHEVLVFCTGNAWADPATHGAKVVLNGSNGQIVTRVDLDTPLGTPSIGQLAAYIPEKQEAYAIYDDGRMIYRFNTQNNSLDAVLEVGGAPINALTYDPRREYLYLGRLDAQNPFTAQGTLTVHTRQGVLVDTFHGAGVIPTDLSILTTLDE